MAKLEIALTLDQRQLDWLQNMADKYSLPTADKALRIVILYAKREKEFNQSIVKEIDVQNGVTGQHAIDKVHDDYLEEVVRNYKLASKDQAVQIIVDYATSNIDEKTLFEVKRCKHGDRGLVLSIGTILVAFCNAMSSMMDAKGRHRQSQK